MALDSGSTGFTTWVDADVAERVRFGQSKFERIAQNQLAFNNRMNRLNNPWSDGDDFHTHFARRIADMGNYLEQGNMAGGGTFVEDEENHTVDLNHPGSGNASGEYLITQTRMRPDKVPVLAEFRAENSAYGTSDESAVGLVSANPAQPGVRTAPTAFVNAAIFITGATSGTWDAVSIDSSTERTRTSSISGTNYTSWDRLRVVLDGTDALFYVHDGSSWVLKATHSGGTFDLTSQQGSLLYCGAWAWGQTGLGSGHTLSLDYMIHRANENVLSA